MHKRHLIFLIYYYITMHVCLPHYYDLSTLVGCWSSVYIRIFKCVSFWLHGFCGKMEFRYSLSGLTTPVGWLVTPTDRPKSVRNRFVIEVFGGVFVLSIGFRNCCWYKGFFHRTKSDLLFLFMNIRPTDRPPNSSELNITFSIILSCSYYCMCNDNAAQSTL